jgi:hypothetical protein
VISEGLRADLVGLHDRSRRRRAGFLLRAPSPRTRAAIPSDQEREHEDEGGDERPVLSVVQPVHRRTKRPASGEPGNEQRRTHAPKPFADQSAQ